MNIERECGYPPGTGGGIEHFLPDIGIMAARCPVLFLDAEITELYFTYQESAKGGFPPPDTYAFAEFCRFAAAEANVDNIEMLD